MKLFVNASLPTASSAFKRVSVLFEDKICKIAPELTIPEEVTETIDLGGKILLPGAIDPHCHLFSGKDPAIILAKASKTALSGGWTSLAELSYFAPKPVFSQSDLQTSIAGMKGNTYVDLALWGNVNIADYPYHAEAAQELWVAGVVGLALMSPASNPAIPALSFTEIMDLFMDIYESDTAFAFQGFDHENHTEYSFASQLDAIKKLLRRMQENPIHIPHVASFPTIEFINSISKRSDISFSMCLADLMQHFSGAGLERNMDLTEQQDLFFDLLRTNKIYLLSNNSEGPDRPPDADEAFRGAPGQLMAFSYVWALSELWKKRKVPLATVLKMTSENAAKRLGLYPAKGCLEAGSDADFVIYDPEGKTTGKLPGGGTLELEGAIESVWLRGTRVFHKGKATAPEGRFLARTTNPKRRHNNTTWI